jgi:hypothetical protein
MSDKWHVTYETWTEEDAEYGDTDDRGFVLEDVSLREAIEACGGEHASYEPSSSNHKDARWLTNDNYKEDFTSGATEQRSLHIPDHITPSSRLRLMRYLGVR